MERQELSSAIERIYPQSVISELAHWIGSDSEPAAIAEKALSSERRESVEPAAVGVLAALWRRGAPMRGARLLREVILWGGEDAEAELCLLLKAGLVLVKPEPGKRDWSLADVLERRRFLQREVFCPTKVLTWLLGSDRDDEGRQRDFVLDGDTVEGESEVAADQLWRNLLQLHGCLDGDALILNRDGTPNKRSMLRFARVLELPSTDGQNIEAGFEDRLLMLLALSLSLGLLKFDGQAVLADVDAASAFFAQGNRKRDRNLLKGWRTNQYWREDVSVGSESNPERRPSLVSEWGKILGVRDQLLEDIRALEVEDHWCDVEMIVAILVRLDRGFIGQAVDVPPEVFVRAVLEVGLHWHGWAALGTTSEGRRAIRLTKSGQRLFAESSWDAPPEQKVPSLVVQPNMEVTVFLQEVDLADLYKLQQVGERRQLSDHAAIYEVMALKTQRAYSRGLSSDDLIEFLEKNGRTPLPDNVAYVLRDWQRVQKKVTLYTTGALLQLPDPDRLDSMQDNLRYGASKGVDIRRVAIDAIFLPGSDGRSLGRVLDFDSLHSVDYAQSPGEIFEHVESLKLSTRGKVLDIISRKVLIAIADESDGDWILDVDKIKSKWKASPADRVIEFLNPRLKGGIKPQLEIELRARIADLKAGVYEEALVVTLEDEFIVHRLLEIYGVEEMITARLGPRALLVAPGQEGDFKTLLADLGLVPTQEKSLE
jgi:hypothetical protein